MRRKDWPASPIGRPEVVKAVATRRPGGLASTAGFPVMLPLAETTAPAGSTTCTTELSLPVLAIVGCSRPALASAATLRACA